MKPFKGWVAESRAGNAAPGFGIYMTKRELVAVMLNRYGYPVGDDCFYRAVRVTIAPYRARADQRKSE